MRIIAETWGSAWKMISKFDNYDIIYIYICNFYSFKVLKG